MEGYRFRGAKLLLKVNTRKARVISATHQQKHPSRPLLRWRYLLAASVSHSRRSAPVGLKVRITRYVRIYYHCYIYTTTHFSFFLYQFQFHACIVFMLFNLYSCEFLFVYTSSY